MRGTKKRHKKICVIIYQTDIPYLVRLGSSLPNTALQNLLQKFFAFAQLICETQQIEI
jgi:hypothetical protein